MIRMTMYRDRGSEHFDQGSYEVTPERALRSLVTGELAFGGNITEATGTRLVVVTRVLVCVDTTIFEGTAEEMHQLNQVVYYYLQACGRQDDVLLDSVLLAAERLLGQQAGNAFLLTTAAPMLMGRQRLALAALLAAGVTDEQDIAAGMRLSLDDLLAALELVQENSGSSLADMVAAVTA